MVDRYQNKTISGIFSDENKLMAWQKVELAVIAAYEEMKLIPLGPHLTIEKNWSENPIDLEWWKKRDVEIHHDLNAFLDERLRFLPDYLHKYVHKNITSYDTEEPAFHRMLLSATECVNVYYDSLIDVMIRQANTYRYTIMMARTHGQEAELQSFGARILTWIVDLRQAYSGVELAQRNLHYCKLSGAIGKYGDMNPEIERLSLSILGFEPFHGATQIIPRTLQVPLAQSLMNLAMVIDKIGNDIRLSARSGRPLMQEPFGKKQKGSSAMPQKKNPIRTEQLEGMARMAKGFCDMIVGGIRTWEERSIEQSSVERIAWPDLFHVLCQALSVTRNVMDNLKVYPDNMLEEVYLARGVYASSAVKEFFKSRLEISELNYEDVYRIVQLACFNVFEPSADRLEIRNYRPSSMRMAEIQLSSLSALQQPKVISIKDFLPAANLRITDALDVCQEEVERYNRFLSSIFQDEKNLTAWQQIFSPSFLLRNEDLLFFKILPSVNE